MLLILGPIPLSQFSLLHHQSSATLKTPLGALPEFTMYLTHSLALCFYSTLGSEILMRIGMPLTRLKNEREDGGKRRCKQERRTLVKNMECCFEFRAKTVVRSCTSAQQMPSTLKPLYQKMF